MNNIMEVEQESENKSLDEIVLSPLSLINIPKFSEENIENKSNSTDIKQSKWKIIKNANPRILPRYSKGEIKLHNLIDELKKFSIEEQNQKTEQISINNSSKWIKITQQKFSQYLSQPIFHYCIIILVIIDLIVVLVDLVLAQLSSPCLTDEEMLEYNTTEQRDTCLLPYSISLSRGELFLFYFSVCLLVVFVLEIFITFFTFGWRHYTNPLYLLDSIIVLASFIMEIYFHYGNIGRAGRAAAAIVILRLWKIIRAIHAVAHSITVKNRLLIKKLQEAQTTIEEEKQNTEKMLEKQDIKVEYLSNILRKINKLPNSQQIDTYVDKIWTQRNKTT